MIENILKVYFNLDQCWILFIIFSVFYGWYVIKGAQKEYKVTWETYGNKASWSWVPDTSNVSTGGYQTFPPSQKLID